MKKIKLNIGKLQLKKESILSLTRNEQNAINGGATPSGENTCGNTQANCGTGIGCTVDLGCVASGNCTGVDVCITPTSEAMRC